MSTQSYPDPTLIDVAADKFAYQQEHGEYDQCSEARRHEWWRTSIFTNENERVSTLRYTCEHCMNRATIELDLPPVEAMDGETEPYDLIHDYDDYRHNQ